MRFSIHHFNNRNKLEHVLATKSVSNVITRFFKLQFSLLLLNDYQVCIGKQLCSVVNPVVDLLGPEEKKWISVVADVVVADVVVADVFPVFEGTSVMRAWYGLFIFKKLDSVPSICFGNALAYLSISLSASKTILTGRNFRTLNPTSKGK